MNNIFIYLVKYHQSKFYEKILYYRIIMTNMTKVLFYYPSLFLLGILLFSGCFPEDQQTEVSEHDFVSTPVSFRVVSEHRSSQDMFPSAKTYEFSTCLKDRTTLKTLATSKFIVNDINYVSDESGCLFFQETVEFNPYEQSRSLSKSFIIKGEGRYPGRLEIHYLLNPWSGFRPTASAEFVEQFNADIDSSPTIVQQQVSAQEGSGSVSHDKWAYVGVKSVKKNIFHHNPGAREYQTHWNFEIQPYVKVFDVNGTASSLVPDFGKLDLSIEIMTISRQLSLTQENLSKAQTIKKYLFSDLEINSGKILLVEKIKSLSHSSDQNLLVHFSLSSDSDLASQGLKSIESLYFVRSNRDNETLQEVNIANDPTTPVDSVVYQDDHDSSAFFARDPKIKIARVIQSFTTYARLSLEFSAQLFHKVNGEKLSNLDLYVTHQGNTELIKSNPDGVIKFPFNYRYSFYRPVISLPMLEFDISNKEKTFSFVVRLFIKPWEYFRLSGAPVISINPDYLPEQTVSSYRALSFDPPTPFVESMIIDESPDIVYGVRKDLSLNFKHSFRFSGNVKLSHSGLNKFGFNNKVNAPDGIYLMEVYLTCTEDGLENKSLYRVDIDLDKHQVGVYRPLPNRYNQSTDSASELAYTSGYFTSDNDPSRTGRVCPSYKQSVRVVVENGKFVTNLQFDTSEPRALWAKMQLSVMINPYNTGVIKNPISDSRLDSLNRLDNSIFMVASLILYEAASNSDRLNLVRIEDDQIDNSQSTEFNNSFKNRADVELLTKKWMVASNYFQYLNSLDSDYLVLNNLRYVSLENRPYSSLFPEIEYLSHDLLGIGQELYRPESSVASRYCTLNTKECFGQKSTNLSYSYDQFVDHLHPQPITFRKSHKFFNLIPYESLPRKVEIEPISDDDMRQILWNFPNNRLEELKLYMCEKWKNDYIQSFNEYIEDVTKPSAVNPSIDPLTLLAQDRVLQEVTVLANNCYSAVLNDEISDIEVYESIVSLRLLKGDVVDVEAIDAGSDIITYQGGNQKSFAYGVNIFSSLSVDMVAFLLSISRSLGAIGGNGISYSITSSAEQEAVDGTKLNSGFNHYSHWSTIMLKLQFDQPRYCLNLRLDPVFIAMKIKSILESGIFSIDNLIVEDYPYYQVHVLNRYARKISSGYLICTDQEPQESYYGEDPTVVAESYRLPKPRFKDKAAYENFDERFRRWLYPIRGDADFLKFQRAMGDLPDANKSDRYYQPSSSYDFMTSMVDWITSTSVKKVNHDMEPAMAQFSLFPKKYVFDKFAKVPPAVGGFYTFYENKIQINHRRKAVE